MARPERAIYIDILLFLLILNLIYQEFIPNYPRFLYNLVCVLSGGSHMARGGFREGAGRPSGSTNKSSPELSQRLSELAKTYTEEALQTLVDVARNGRTDAARVSAANALLDRAYGKPAVKEEQETVDLPPVVIQLTGPS
jgi:hypothetical protein